MLQEMLDEHAGWRRTDHLLNAVIGGSPVGRLISAPGSEDYEATSGAMRRDFFGPEARLRGEVPPPTVALLQQSLRGATLKHPARGGRRDIGPLPVTRS